MAIGTELCLCGHEQSVHGKGVRGGVVYQSDSPCRNCGFEVALVKCQVPNQHRLSGGMAWVPYNHLPSVLTEGEEFSYSTPNNLRVDCLIVSVVRQEAEYGYYAPSSSLGGKTEYNHNRGQTTVVSPAKVTVTLTVTVTNELEKEVGSFGAVVIKHEAKNGFATMTIVP